MDQSIISRAALAAIGKARKVNQHLSVAAGRSTFVGRKSIALATALASCADEPCGKLSLNELAMVMSHRMKDEDVLATVSSHTLFELFVSIDTELQSRAEREEHEPFREDIPAVTPYASAYGEDNPDHSELEAYAVRSIHAEILDYEEDF